MSQPYGPPWPVTRIPLLFIFLFEGSEKQTIHFSVRILLPPKLLHTAP
jgi:hypothetical protein